MYYPVVFSILTRLCNHHYLIPEHFYHLRRNPVLISNHSPSAPPPTPLQLLIRFLPYRLAYFGHFMHMESYSTWLLVSGFSSLLSCHSGLVSVISYEGLEVASRRKTIMFLEQILLRLSFTEGHRNALRLRAMDPALCLCLRTRAVHHHGN